MGLKKIFPIIFLLITLSLVGIIYIQINWIVTMIENKREALSHNMADAVRSVADGLTTQRVSAPSFKSFPLKPGSMWRPADPLLMEMMRIPPITQTFSPTEINNRLRKAFNSRGLKNAHFEFAVYSNIGSTSDMSFQAPELRSANFIPEFLDSVNNVSFNTVLQAPESADANSVLPDEGIIVVVHDFKGLVQGEMRIMIASAIFSP